MKYTQNTLDKLENVTEQAGYVLRYERGTFQSGYCILEEKKVIVLNKFLQTEGRINTMVDLIPQLDINTDLLGSFNLDWWDMGGDPEAILGDPDYITNDPWDFWPLGHSQDDHLFPFS